MRYYETLSSVGKDSGVLKKYAQKYATLLEDSMEELDKLETIANNCDTCEEACKGR